MIQLYNNEINVRIPNTIITSSLVNADPTQVLQEMQEISKYYLMYKDGVKFLNDTKVDYLEAELKCRLAKTLIDKEARFLFAESPDIKVQTLDETDSTDMQMLLNKILKNNAFDKNLLYGAKDCFIGKRIAMVLNFNDQGVEINFISSLNFVVEYDKVDRNKIINFFTWDVIKSTENVNKEIYKKRMWMQDGYMYFEEYIVSNNNETIETINEATKSMLTYIPVVIIKNDELLINRNGVSEMQELFEFESWYSKLSNMDIDAERKSMNPVVYTVDMASNTTKGLSRSSGSFWDLASDFSGSENAKGTVGIIENNMSYSSALESTLKRTKKNAYALLDVPDIEELQTQLTSGKAIKSVYWGLIVRCSEKMKTWQPAIEKICNMIFDGALIYPNSIATYGYNKSVIIDDYEIMVENNYPIQEDIDDETQLDILKVQSQTMSKKSFMIKWNNLTEEQADLELEQMAKEREMLENSYGI